MAIHDPRMGAADTARTWAAIAAFSLFLADLVLR
jgi:hypothetical protein